MQVKDTISILVCRCLDSFGSVSSEAIISEELARFKVWTANVDNYNGWKNSLGTSLREASHIRNQIKSLLKDLDACLRNVDDINNERTIPWDQSSVTEEISELHRDEATGSPQRNEHDIGFRSERDQMYAEMIEIVDCLYQLTASVHNPAPHDRYMLMKEIIDVSKYERLDTENILRNFSSVRPELAARLGRANTRRRQYLSNRRAAHGYSSEGQNWSAASFTATIGDAIFPQRTTNDDYGSGICPCCFMSITPGALNWARYIAQGGHEPTNREHIYDDLTPYVCLEDDCHNGDMQYKSIHQWIEHVVHYHWRTWTCGMCLDTSFDKPILLEAHLEKEHVFLETSQIAALIIPGQGPKNTDNSTMCPLCGESLKNLEAYSQHVGGHQEKVALSILELQKQEASSTRVETKRHAPDDGMSTHDSKRKRIYIVYSPETSPEP